MNEADVILRRRVSKTGGYTVPENPSPFGPEEQSG
jgi:hypothetical protein